MRFGFFTPVSPSPGEPPGLAAERGVAEILYAEALGWDDVWLAETPFARALAFGGTSLIFAAMLAAKTSRIRIGTAITPLPLHDPIETAMAAACVDNFSHGRFDLGIGRGQRSYGQSGVSLLDGSIGNPGDADWRAQYLESIECVLGMLGQESFSYKGDYYEYSNLNVSPRPYQDPLPVWAVAQSPQTYIEMAQRGVHLLIPIPGYHGGVDSWEGTRELLNEYRKTWKDSGHAGEPQVTMRIPTFMGKTNEQASDVARRTIELCRTRFIELLASVTGAPVDNTTDTLRQFGLGPFAIIFSREFAIDSAIETITFTGSPEIVVERLEHLRDELQLDGVMIEAGFFGQTSREDHIRTLRLMADEVMPQLK